MTDEPERDPNYDAIMEFINLNDYNKKSDHYKYMIKLKDKWNTDKIYCPFSRKTYLKYNYYIYNF